MASDHIRGRVREAAGKAQEVVGDLTDDAGEQLGGKARQLAGRAQADYGQAIGRVRDFVEEQPVAALLAAGGVGALLGMLWLRRK